MIACAVVVPSPWSQAATESYVDTLKQIRSEYSSNQIVDRACEELQSTLSTQLEELPSDLRSEVKIAVNSRLEALISNLQEYSVKEYRGAMLAYRLVELAGNVSELKFRPIASTLGERQKASTQYVTLLNEADGRLKAEGDAINGAVSEIVAKAFQDVLEPVQRDVFVFGYGEPVSDATYAEIQKGIDVTIGEAVKFSATINTEGLPPARLREAAEIASNGRTALREAIQRNTFRVLSSEPAAAESATWSAKVSPLQSDINIQKRAAEKQEIESIIKKTQAESKGAAERSRAKMGEIASVDDSGNSRANDGRKSPEGFFTTSRVLITINIIVIAVLVLFALSRRK